RDLHKYQTSTNTGAPTGIPCAPNRSISTGRTDAQPPFASFKRTVRCREKLGRNPVWELRPRRCNSNIRLLFDAQPIVPLLSGCGVCISIRKSSGRVAPSGRVTEVGVGLD